MKILFTSRGNKWDSNIDTRFGRSDLFLIYDEDNDKIECIPNFETETMRYEAGIQTANKLLILNIDIIIAGDEIGHKAFNILKQANIKIYIGNKNINIAKNYEAYKLNKLKIQN